MKKMKYIGEEEREVPGCGVFRPGDVVDFDERLHATGLFSVIENKTKAKEGDA
jgi:hypothetical protein